YIRQLRRTYQTAIISNAMDDLHDFVQVRYPMADAFDLIVGSAYEKVMKPAPVIFERTLERLGRAAQEAVFIDDFAYNIDGAGAVGMAAIHYQPGIGRVAELAALGVAPARYVWGAPVSSSASGVVKKGFNLFNRPAIPPGIAQCLSYLYGLLSILGQTQQPIERRAEFRGGYTSIGVSVAEQNPGSCLRRALAVQQLFKLVGNHNLRHAIVQAFMHAV